MTPTSKQPPRPTVSFSTMAMILVAAVSIAVSSVVLPAGAFAQGETPTETPTVTPLQQDWHTFVDETEGIALDLPPTHAVGATGYGTWYVHGFVDGDPTVPDVSITFVEAAPGASLERILGQGALDGALVERVYLGRGVPAQRVTAEYETYDGNAYVSSLYVVPVTHGAYVISRYESFDWHFFEHVALSFRFVK